MTEGLTDFEHATMVQISQVSSMMRTMIQPEASAQNAADWQECAADIHRLQMRVMSKAATRAHPNRYRSLAGPPYAQP